MYTQDAIIESLESQGVTLTHYLTRKGCIIKFSKPFTNTKYKIIIEHGGFIRVFKGRTLVEGYYCNSGLFKVVIDIHALFNKG